jgi:hypothetical protein
MLAVPLFPEAEGVQALRPVDGEHAVQVIDLVLEQLRPITFDVHFLPFAFQILITYPNAVSARDANQEIGERKAIIPDFEVFSTDVYNLGVDQRPGTIHLDISHADRRTDLRGRNSTATSKPRLPIPQRFPQVVHDDSDAGRSRFGNRLATGAEYRVA